MAKRDPLAKYRSKRHFDVTAEPASGGVANDAARSFVVQKHWASRLHYDVRLELDGTMKSWAVPKGPSYDTRDKRMAVHVEDHPISYNTFEGEIPKGEYGAGKVIVWDKGTWVPVGDPHEAYEQGKLKFELHGHKLQGRWTLVRMRGKRDSEREPAWLLIKEKDDFARPASEFSVVDEMPDSVAALAPVEPATSPGAALPASLAPQLATLVDAPPADSSQWLYEIKFDGYRLLTRIEAGSARLYTRQGHDWSNRMAALVNALNALKLPDGWYDGEIVVHDERGLPDFQALQNAFDSAKTASIVYYLFDLPYCDGSDLRSLPLVERRERLRALLADAPDGPVRFSETFDVPGRDIVASACKLGLEGVIGKNKTSRYVSGRTSSWIKLKCSERQEFVIGGYTDPQGSRVGLGALLLGVYDEDAVLRYAGKVGTGFDDRSLQTLKERLATLHSDKSPFGPPAVAERGAHWVKPELVAEVSFAQWTRTGRIRHAVFAGLRTDKPPSAIKREDKMPPPATTPQKSLLSGIKITSADRIVDPSTGLTKIDVIRHYALVAPLMMEHLSGRPVSLVRAPDGVKGQQFFQKHLETARMKGVRSLSQKLDPDHEPLIEIATEQGLVSAAQMNAFEFHTWNAVKTAIKKPDRIVFDLDPGKGVEWTAMQEAAQLLHAFLTELELPSFLKTSGGQGLHVIVPIKRTRDWDTVKDFSHAIVLHMAKTLPSRFSAKSGPRNRVGKIFIDYLRNGFGSTTVAAWSARARPGMGVSVPVAWDELESLKSSAQWHVGNIHTRLDRGNDPWKAYDESPVTLTRAMKILGYERSV